MCFFPQVEQIVKENPCRRRSRLPEVSSETITSARSAVFPRSDSHMDVRLQSSCGVNNLGRSPKAERWLKRVPSVFRSPSSSVSNSLLSSKISSPSLSIATKLGRTGSKHNHPTRSPRAHEGQQWERDVNKFKRNQSTPNLQVPPDLSPEDRGKVNAFYAPPPPAATVQTVSPVPIHRRTVGGHATVPAVSSADKPRPIGPMPDAVPKRIDLEEWDDDDAGESPSATATVRSPIPITLPLAGNYYGSGWDSPDIGGQETGTIYFTLDESCEVEDGEAMLTIVDYDR